MKKLICVFLLLFGIFPVMASDWMPDSSLRQAIREKLKISKSRPLETSDLLRLDELIVLASDIANLEGIQYATNLVFLHIGDSQISDLSPLTGLQKLEILKLYSNQISDISMLPELVNLQVLQLQNNPILDITPLGELTNLISLTVDEACDLPPETVIDRIENRDYPSIFSAWGHIQNLPDTSYLEKIVQHDLYFCCLIFDTHYLEIQDSVWVMGDLGYGQRVYEAYRQANPKMLFLVNLRMRSAPIDDTPDLPYWIRDANGDPIRDPFEGGEFAFTDFTHPGMQKVIIEKAVAVAKCGRYDGIFFDWWSEEFPILFDDSNHGTGFRGLQAEQDARDNILAGIRSQVRDDFLILVNGGRKKFPRTAWAINGTFMETLKDTKLGYTHEGLQEIESTLRWAEENLREPRINCLEGFSIRTQALDSPQNLKWMRVFTTMSLTHSDGYVLHNDGYTHEHYWYDFWDANLGRPLTEKSQHYNNIDGVFIREFTNGWTVFNRSGIAQTIRLPEQTTGVSSQLSATEHLLADLDGEIYLKRSSDLNADGVINILDLVLVASALGTDNASYDLNGDSVVNILDLVSVANDLGE